jgi:hypothetical protein
MRGGGQCACLEQGFQRFLALLLGGGHVESTGVDNFIGHVDLGLLDIVAHQRLYAVRIFPLPCLRLPSRLATIQQLSGQN